MKFSEYVASKAITLCFLGIGALLAVIAPVSYTHLTLPTN